MFYSVSFYNINFLPLGKGFEIGAILMVVMTYDIRMPIFFAHLSEFLLYSFNLYQLQKFIVGRTFHFCFFIGSQFIWCLCVQACTLYIPPLSNILQKWIVKQNIVINSQFMGIKCIVVFYLKLLKVLYMHDWISYSFFLTINFNII